jgi:hypothetical protein
MESMQSRIETNFRRAVDSVDRGAMQFPVSVEDMNEFLNDTTRAKLAAWAASTTLGLRHKLTDMAIQAVK